MMGKICRPCVFFRLPLYSDDEEVDGEDREREREIFFFMYIRVELYIAMT